MNRLWLRPEASAAVGLGHLMRCVALGEAARASGWSVFVVTGDPELVAPVAARYGLGVVDFTSFRNRRRPGDVAVFDGYGISVDEEAMAHAEGLVVVAQNDHGTGAHHADVVIHQNLAPTLHVEALPDSQLLAGPRYALVRREFTGVRRDADRRRSRVLVTLGGADSGRLSARIAEELHRGALFDEVLVLAGRAAPVLQVPRAVRVVRDPESVSAVMRSVDAAVSAAGSTTWELLCVGVPTALIQTAPNQVHIARPVADHGAALFLGTSANMDLAPVERLQDPELRERLARRGHELVDGHGADRVLEALTRWAERRRSPFVD